MIEIGINYLDKIPKKSRVVNPENPKIPGIGIWIWKSRENPELSECYIRTSYRIRGKRTSEILKKLIKLLTRSFVKILRSTWLERARRFPGKVQFCLFSKFFRSFVTFVSGSWDYTMLNKPPFSTKIPKFRNYIQKQYFLYKLKTKVKIHQNTRFMDNSYVYKVHSKKSFWLNFSSDIWGQK